MVHIFSNSTFSKMNSDGQKEIGRSGNCTSNSSYTSNHTSNGKCCQVVFLFPLCGGMLHIYQTPLC